jgi:Fic family protein
LRSFLATPPLASVPLEAATLLARIDNGRGREELHRAQAPQVLERLAASARYQSITASNAIEDVVVSEQRALELIGAPEGTSYADRTESEFAGYRDASDYLMSKPSEALSVPLLLHLHRLLLRNTGDPLAGKLKTDDNYIGRKELDGTTVRIFTPVPAGEQTTWHLEELVARYENAVRDGRTPVVALVALLVLDVLAIHPFADGNGRIARLLTTCELMRHGYGVARYASLEQRIFDSKNSYYAALRLSQEGWHAGEHDPWLWSTYLLRILDDAYADFEARVVAGRTLIGTTKLEQARDYILTQVGDEFAFAELVVALPDISQATLRNALGELSAEGRVVAGRGRSAKWRRIA